MDTPMNIDKVGELVTQRDELKRHLDVCHAALLEIANGCIGLSPYKYPFVNRTKDQIREIALNALDRTGGESDCLTTTPTPTGKRG